MCSYHTYHLPVSVPELLAPWAQHPISTSTDFLKDIAPLNFPSFSYSISFLLSTEFPLAYKFLFSPLNKNHFLLTLVSPSEISFLPATVGHCE